MLSRCAVDGHMIGVLINAIRSLVVPIRSKSPFGTFLSLTFFSPFFPPAFPRAILSFPPHPVVIKSSLIEKKLYYLPNELEVLC